MLSSLRNTLRVPDLRNKILFTLLMIGLYRVGSFIPAPGVDLSAVSQVKESAQDGGTNLLTFLNLFSGGALTQAAIFALGIMPYITSSIVMQLLTVVIPKLEEWQKQGAVGQRKITQWTRYVAVMISLMQATGLAFIFHRGGSSFYAQNDSNVQLLPDFAFARVALFVLTLTAGTALLMWMGELITNRGIGNGMSLLIMASVVQGLPFQYAQVKAEKSWGVLIVLLVASIAMLCAIVFVEQGQRRIPVQFAKRQVGRRVYGGQNTYIPLKVNQSGVIPIIFASSVLYLPVLATNIVANEWLIKFTSDHLTDASSPIHIALYGLLIIGFAYFYTFIAFDPVQQADSIRKQGGFIPGIRPGPQTERYLNKVLNRITFPGAIFIAAIALIPSLTLVLFSIDNAPFGGTTILIAVGVALETVKQIDSQLMMRNYEGFLKS